MTYSEPRAAAADFGVDAPPVLAGFAAGSAAALAAAVVATRARACPGLKAAAWAVTTASSLFTAYFVYGTRRGKFAVWDEELERLGLRGDETVVDLGCGRGAVLLAAARRLPRGRAVGVDLWRSVDQSGNDPAVTRANARALGVDDRVELHTADVRAVPLPDGCADVVVSSLTIHNLHDPHDRATAVREAARLLRPGGRLVVLDLSHVADYAKILRATGLVDIHHRNAGVHFLVGRLLTATRPR